MISRKNLDLNGNRLQVTRSDNRMICNLYVSPRYFQFVILKSYSHAFYDLSCDKYSVQAFSYFHFLINENEKFDIHNIFGQYDTDGTGTWSDREIRTLLTRIYSLPLSLDNINSFEKNISDCERNLTESGIKLPIPEKISRVYERYYDSKLPLVTEFLVIRCPTIVTFLKNSLGDSPKYKHKIMDEVEKYATFRRITSNIR